ncbi:MAG: hypothetical protein FJX74_13910 [Armatimonadetes bacterium]|nr:hypothetical protein [Armatimonadota bacterium]
MLTQALTVVTIVGDDFHLNGAPTYEGCLWEGHRVEGLLMNSRMVQGIFDDENPETRHLWAYPDTGEWDPERNPREFIAAMPAWREHGLLSFTIDLQGGGPIYGKPWPYDLYVNSAYDPQGSLKPAYMDRLARILRRADELGMAPILSLAYFGMDHRYIDSPDAARTMTDNVVDWLTTLGLRNVLIEIANERMGIQTKAGEVLALELIPRMRARWAAQHPNGEPLYLSTAHGGGGALAPRDLVEIADFVLLHGNGQSPEQHVAMIEATRKAIAEVRGRPDAIPIVFNEAGPWWETDRMNKWMEAMRECVRRHVSWGYFTQGSGRIENRQRVDEPYVTGYQTPPVNWAINTEEKQRFFGELRAITGG